MADGLLAIGAFSRASGLSIKALRAYHESGLLVPSSVDRATGYRSYDASQLIDAALIARLRSLDLPLEQVRQVVHARDPQVTAAVLAQHEATMRDRLADVTRIVNELQASVLAPEGHTAVHRRDVGHQHTLAVRGIVTEANFAEFLGEAFAELGDAAQRLGIAATAPVGGLYPPEIADDGDDVEAYLPIAHPVAVGAGSGRVVLSEVPAATVAVLVHAGPYTTIGDSYRRLGAWVARNAVHRAVPVREVYAVGPPECDDPAGYRTEILWPIEPHT